MIQLSHIQRQRHGQYDNQRESRRQTTVFLSGFKSRKHTDPGIQQDVFGYFLYLWKKVQNIVEQKKGGNIGYADGRLNYRSVQDHINYFPRDESHYGRVKSSKQYLNSEVNVEYIYGVQR